MINRIDDSWEESASEQYIAKMLGYKQKAEKMIEVLSEFKDIWAKQQQNLTHRKKAELKKSADVRRAGI